MTEQTRYARVQRSVADLRSVDGTSVSTFGRHEASTREFDFNQGQRAMASAVREEKRRGVAFFAHHPDFGPLGRLWLEAGDAPRAGTLGRHDSVDLPLPLDESLSLRHVLFIVRAVAGEVRLTVLDLASSAGLLPNREPALRRLDVAGAATLRLGEFEVLAVPTGGALPWDPDAEDPSSTLRLATPTLTRPREWAKPTQRHLREVAGCLAATLGDLRSERALTEDDLVRGFLVGRQERCDLRLPDNRVSRVHAAVLRVDGQLLLVDAGSTHGLWRAGAEPVRCTAWRAGDPIQLGEDIARLEWSDAH